MLLTKWTIRLALACYVACLASGLSRRACQWTSTRRVIWTLGCVLFFVHVACAFHFSHRWSHALAWQHTAERTRELLGVAVGDGIYFNYLFGVLWLADVVWLWLSPRFTTKSGRQTAGSPANPVPASATCVPERHRGRFGTPRWRLLVHIFLLFMAVNGAIVFEAGPTRWAGLVVVMALGCLVVRRTGYWPRRDVASSARESIHKPEEEPVVV